MSRVTTEGTATPAAGRPADVVDPRAPRFGQGITTFGLVAGIALQEPAAPHRFAKLVGATFTGVASALLLLGSTTDTAVLATGGFALAAVVAVLAAIAAVLDICVGCRMYEQVSFFRRLGWV